MRFSLSIVFLTSTSSKELLALCLQMGGALIYKVVYSFVKSRNIYM
jgi:hypothetical protein